MNNEQLTEQTTGVFDRPDDAAIKSKAAMQMALEALEVSTDWDVGARGKQLQSMKAITALREALAQPQEPLTLENAPIGTRAPAFGGGAWVKTKHGWRWNDNASTFPRPGGDWNGELIAPKQPQGEPVYYQWRRKNQPWSIRHVYHNKVEATTDDSEVRELYTTPPSVEAAIERERLMGYATAQMAVEAMRIETLEKAAKVCDDIGEQITRGKYCAAAIRSMK